MTKHEVNDRATRILNTVAGWMDGREWDTNKRDELLRGEIREVAREFDDPTAWKVMRAINQQLS